MALKLYDHQNEMLAFLTENDRGLLLAEAGAGKSLPTLCHLSNLLLSGEVTKALIIAPLSGLGAWERDTEKLSPTRQALLKDAVTYCNYDKISRKDSRWQKLLWQDWDFIALDEGHAIAKPTSNRTKYLIGSGKRGGLAHQARFAYDITGTLLNNSRLEDAWSPLRMVFGESWEYYLWADFKRHFLVTRTLPGTYADIVVGYRHREELLTLLASCSYRVLLKDCLDLPAVLPDEIVAVPWKDGKNAEPFAKTTRTIYEEALDSFVDDLDMVMDNPLTRRLRIRQIASGHIKESDTRDEDSKRHVGTTYLLNNHKTKYAMELIEDNLPNKIVVGYQFSATGESLMKALDKAGIKYLSLNGKTKDKTCWRKFQSDPNIKVFVVQYQSGSEAIDLFAACRTILMEPMDSCRTLTQFRNRTNRNGQTRPCSYVWLLTEGSIEFDMYQTLQGHRDFDDAAWREVAEARKRMRC